MAYQDLQQQKLKTIKVKHFNDHITIIKRSNVISILYLTVFSLIWCVPSFLGFFLGIIKGNVEIILWALLFVLSGILILYYTITLWINRTYIIVDDKGISAHYKPLPLPQVQDVAIKLIKLEGLKIEKKVSDNQNGTSTTYEIHVISSNNTSKKLIKLRDYDEALFIKKTIENYLNIKDDSQEGEVSSVG